MRNSNFLKQTLLEPERPDSLPKTAHWLAGEGAGSWFYIENNSTDNSYKIKRFSPKGKLECEGVFEVESSESILILNQPYKFVHLSHCAFVHIEQEGHKLKLNRIEDSEFKIIYP